MSAPCISPSTSSLLQVMSAAYAQVRLRRADDPFAMPSPAGLRIEVEQEIVRCQESIDRTAEDARGKSPLRHDIAARKIKRLEKHIGTLRELRSKMEGR